MTNDITELRQHLFDTLRGIKDGSMKIESAKAINETAQTIINTAKVEVDHMKLNGGCSRFISVYDNPALFTGQTQTTATQGGTKTVTQFPGGSVTQHRMGG